MTEAGKLYRSLGFREIPGCYASRPPGVIYFALDFALDRDSMPAA